MTPHSGEILDGLRPRMRKARVAHVRRMMAGLALVPLIGFGAVAMAADTAADPELDVAGSGELDSPLAPKVDLPDIGDGDSAENETPVEEVDEAPVKETKVLSLGPLGNAEAVETDGGFELLHADLVGGWEVHSVVVTDDGIVLVIKMGDSMKVITITDGVRDEVDVEVSDLVIPTTTTIALPTTTTVKKHEPEPTPTVVDRFEVVVPERGRFIVERDGDKLFVGDVTANDRYEYTSKSPKAGRSTSSSPTAIGFGTARPSSTTTVKSSSTSGMKSRRSNRSSSGSRSPTSEPSSSSSGATARST